MDRRDVLFRCFATGVLTAVLSPDDAVAALLESERLAATPAASIGPFFKRGSPERRLISPPGAAGVPLHVEGRAMDTHGEALTDAVIELWHADHGGDYDNAGFNYRGHFKPDAGGRYAFDSVVPGHYPGRLAQHVHYLITAPGMKTLGTQLYFATDPAFEGDPARTYKRDPIITSASLIRPVHLEPEGKGVVAKVTFELVLERA